MQSFDLFDDDEFVTEAQRRLESYASEVIDFAGVLLRNRPELGVPAAVAAAEIAFVSLMKSAALTAIAALPPRDAAVGQLLAQHLAARTTK